MKYLIIHWNNAFYTEWYDYENNYVEGMIIVKGYEISYNGKDFELIEFDNL